jgi:hypothetical protein
MKILQKTALVLGTVALLISARPVQAQAVWVGPRAPVVVAPAWPVAPVVVAPVWQPAPVWGPAVRPVYRGWYGAGYRGAVWGPRGVAVRGPRGGVAVRRW